MKSMPTIAFEPVAKYLLVHVVIVIALLAEGLG